MSSLGTIYDNMMSGLRVHSQTLARLQEQVSSGLRVIRPSDSPVDTFQIMAIQAQNRTLAVHSEQKVPIAVENRDHPITNGLESWEMTDEVYEMKGPVGGEVLLTTSHARSMPILAWVISFLG